jgi:predicted double-glycine peptidase
MHRALFKRASLLPLTQALWCCVVGLMTFGCACASVLAQPPKSLPVTLTRQQAGFDCGSAALATLLSFYTDRAVEPDDLVRSQSFTTDEWQLVRREGFSLVQLAHMAAALKVKPSVTRLPSRALLSVPLPVLVYLRLPTGPHFSVLTGIAGQRVTLVDPSQGALMWTLNQFLRAWAPDGQGLLLSVKGAPVWSASDPARQ